jgi:hypothetical protein
MKYRIFYQTNDKNDFLPTNGIKIVVLDMIIWLLVYLYLTLQMTIFYQKLFLKSS